MYDDEQRRQTSNSLMVYPNLSTGLFTIQFQNSGKFNVGITVRNTMGQIVYKTASKECYNSQQERINILGKPQGIYMVETVSGEKE